MATTSAEIIERADVWADVIGQDRAVAALRAAAVHPVHAYLLVGPAGSGKRPAALAFAAVLLGCSVADRVGSASGPEVDRAIALALAGSHPDLHVFEPEGASLLTDDADRIIKAASRSPVEGARKVLVLTEFEKVASAGPQLLKTIEEPPASTVFVILAEEVPPELVPIASRSVRIDLGSVPETVIAGVLATEGASDDVARAAAAAAGGDLARARLLVGDRSLGVRRDAWASIPRRVDGTGYTAAQLVDEVIAHIDAAQEPLDARQSVAVDELEAQIEAYGQRGSGKKDLEKTHKREIRRHRVAEIRYGLATMGGVYRDELPRAGDVAPHLAAIAAIQQAAESLTRAPNELLLLQSLVANLDPI